LRRKERRNNHNYNDGNNSDGDARANAVQCSITADIVPVQNWRTSYRHSSR